MKFEEAIGCIQTFELKLSPSRKKKGITLKVVKEEAPSSEDEDLSFGSKNFRKFLRKLRKKYGRKVVFKKPHDSFKYKKKSKEGPMCYDARVMTTWDRTNTNIQI